MPLRHAVPIRHKSFVDPAFVARAQAVDAAIMFADRGDYPASADPSGGFVYARLRFNGA